MKFFYLVLGILVIKFPVVSFSSIPNIVFSILVKSVIVNQQAKFEFLHKFKKISCEASEKRTCENIYCYITTTETSSSLANYGCKLTRTLKSLNVSVIEINLKKKSIVLFIK